MHRAIITEGENWYWGGGMDGGPGTEDGGYFCQRARGLLRRAKSALLAATADFVKAVDVDWVPVDWVPVDCVPVDKTTSDW